MEHLCLIKVVFWDHCRNRINYANQEFMCNLLYMQNLYRPHKMFAFVERLGYFSVDIFASAIFLSAAFTF